MSVAKKTPRCPAGEFSGGGLCLFSIYFLAKEYAGGKALLGAAAHECLPSVSCIFGAVEYPFVTFVNPSSSPATNDFVVVYNNSADKSYGSQKNLANEFERVTEHVSDIWQNASSVSRSAVVANKNCLGCRSGSVSCARLNS